MDVVTGNNDTVNLYADGNGHADRDFIDQRLLPQQRAKNHADGQRDVAGLNGSSRGAVQRG